MKNLINMLMIICLQACAFQPDFRAIFGKNSISAVGYASISTQQSNSHSEKVLMAMKASKLAAYQELAEQIYGNRISSNEQLMHSKLQGNRLQSHVQGIVRGAKVIKSYPSEDFYITELELEYSVINHLPVTKEGSDINVQVDYF